MKKRYEELQRCRGLIDDALTGTPCAGRLRFKQLYHDREEVTGYVACHYTHLCNATQNQ